MSSGNLRLPTMVSIWTSFAFRSLDDSDAISDSLSCNDLKRSVSKIFLRIFRRSSLFASSSFMNCPWGSIEICLHWDALMFRILSMDLVTSEVLPAKDLPPIDSSASAEFEFLLSALWYSGLLVTVYSLPSCSNLSVT